VRFFFGHHPVDNLTYGKDEFLALLKSSQAWVYFYGHTHQWGLAWRDGTLHVNVDALGSPTRRTT